MKTPSSRSNTQTRTSSKLIREVLSLRMVRAPNRSLTRRKRIRWPLPPNPRTNCILNHLNSPNRRRLLKKTILGCPEDKLSRVWPPTKSCSDKTLRNQAFKRIRMKSTTIHRWKMIKTGSELATWANHREIKACPTPAPKASCHLYTRSGQPKWNWPRVTATLSIYSNRRMRSRTSTRKSRKSKAQTFTILDETTTTPTQMIIGTGVIATSLERNLSSSKKSSANGINDYNLLVESMGLREKR